MTGLPTVDAERQTGANLKARAPGLTSPAKGGRNPCPDGPKCGRQRRASRSAPGGGGGVLASTWLVAVSGNMPAGKCWRIAAGFKPVGTCALTTRIRPTWSAALWPADVPKPCGRSMSASYADGRLGLWAPSVDARPRQVAILDPAVIGSASAAASAGKGPG